MGVTLFLLGVGGMTFFWLGVGECDLFLAVGGCG